MHGFLCNLSALLYAWINCYHRGSLAREYLIHANWRKTLRNRGLWIWFVRIQLATPIDWWWLIPGEGGGEFAAFSSPVHKNEGWLLYWVPFAPLGWKGSWLLAAFILILTFCIPCSLMHYSGFVRTEQRSALHPQIFYWSHAEVGV